jgi:F5/8 type C domain-containing protein
MRRLLLVVALLTAPAFGQSFSWWRMNVINAGGSQTDASLFSFYDGTATLIPVTGGTASASNASFGAAADAFDGVCAHFWESNTGATPAAPVWLQMHFTSAVTVASIKLQGRSGNTRGPDTFQMQASNDGSTWTNEGFYNPPSAWNNNTNCNVLTITLDSSSGSGTAWRLLVTATQGNALINLYTWALFAPGGTPITTTPSTGYSFADSEVDSTHPSQYAFASFNSARFWQAKTVPSVSVPVYLAFKFNTTVSSIGSFSITADQLNAPSAFCLQSSPDAATWTSAKCYTATWASGRTTQTFVAGGGPIASMILQ